MSFSGLLLILVVAAILFTAFKLLPPYIDNYRLQDSIDTIARNATYAKMSEADCAILGGHSVNDSEIKFGYAVTGVIHPDRVLRNAGALPGDVLIFTKRLGTGVISTAIKRGIAAEADVQASIASMLELNRKPAEAMRGLTVHGCTDVSGFGLIGHAREMALGSGVTLEIDAASLRFLPGALDYAARGAVPGGLNNNREFASCVVEMTRDLPAELEKLLYDPQTSGGLLISLPEQDALRYQEALPSAYRIGRVLEQAGKPIHIL
jgi:selenide,water dikinase